MLQINILYVGNIKDKFFAQAVAEYEKRLQGLCKIKNIEFIIRMYVFLYKLLKILCFYCFTIC